MSVEDFAEFKNKRPSKTRRSYYYRVDEYNMGGDYLRTWDSIREAERHYKCTGVGAVCRGSRLYVQRLNKIFLKEGDSIEDRLKLIQNESGGPVQYFQKSVREYDLLGNLMAIYPSMTAAYSKTHNTPKTVRDCCLGNILFTRQNRIFLFKDGNIYERLEQIRQNDFQRLLSKSIDEYDKQGHLLHHWRNSVEVTDAYDIPSFKVIECCNGSRNSIKGKIFLFSGENIDKRLKRIKSKKKIK